MIWEDALDLALRMNQETGKRWSVRGYRSASGRWRYAAHSFSTTALAEHLRSRVT